MKNSTKNIVIIFLIFLISILLTGYLFWIEEKKLLESELSNSRKELKLNSENFIKKNQELIEISNKIQKKNDSLSQKSNSEYKLIDGITIGNTPITLEQLINSANKSRKDNNVLRTRIYRDSIKLKNYNIILKKLEDEKVINYKMNDKMEGEYSFINMKKYQQSKNEKDSILDTKSQLIKNYKNEITGKTSALNLIKKYYGIDSKIEIADGVITTKLINTEKIDSALWIYPYYKNKIKTNKKGETFIK